MRTTDTVKLGKRGTLVIPAKFRKELGIDEGDLVIMEETDEGLLIRKAMVLPVEKYTPRRKAQLLLSNAVDEKDYERAIEEVRKMGLDPDNIEHRKPQG